MTDHKKLWWARKQGYEDGKSEGIEEGIEKGYQSGYNEGYDVGYQNASNFMPEDVYQEGYDAGRVDGYDIGFSEGHHDGYNSGSTDGYNSGFSDGYDTGYSKGYDTGKSEGDGDTVPTDKLLYEFIALCYADSEGVIRMPEEHRPVFNAIMEELDSKERERTFGKLTTTITGIGGVISSLDYVVARNTGLSQLVCGMADSASYGFAKLLYTHETGVFSIEHFMYNGNDMTTTIQSALLGIGIWLSAPYSAIKDLL